MADKHIDFNVEPIDEDLLEEMRKVKLVFGAGLIKITPSNSCMPIQYQEHIDRIRRLTVRPDDVWIITYPKCGTTWTQELCWLLMNNLDYEAASKTQLVRRSIFLEFGCLFPQNEEQHDQHHHHHHHFHHDSVKLVEELKSPRVIKSHLPLLLLPQQLWTVKPKIIYVAREAKDVAVSFYHHHKLMTMYEGGLDYFVDVFIKGLVTFGSIWDHILEFWKIRHEPNILFNTFEDMKKDLPGVVTRTAKFLNRTLSDEQLKQLCEHLSFESMKKNPSVNFEEEILKLRNGKPLEEGESFIRKGKVGGWKEELSPEASEKIDNWTRERLAGTDYPVSV